MTQTTLANADLLEIGAAELQRAAAPLFLLDMEGTGGESVYEQMARAQARSRRGPFMNRGR